MTYRLAEFDEIYKIAELRKKLLIEENAHKETDVEQEIINYFKTEFDKSIICAVAEKDGVIIATSSIIIQKYPPTFSNKKGLRGYVANVFTEKEYRRQGISTKLLDLLLLEMKKREISYIWLWATKDGAKMYEKYGFKTLTAFHTMDFLL